MTAQAEPLVQSPAPPHPLREFWFYFSQNPGAVAGLFTILVIILLALLADQISTQSPIEIHTDAFLRPPFWQEGGSLMFPLGTDPIGRDMFSRLVHGTRFSLLIGSMVVSISLVAGI
jgi:dipeptide transport system permease protein